MTDEQRSRTQLAWASITTRLLVLRLGAVVALLAPALARSDEEADAERLFGLVDDLKALGAASSNSPRFCQPEAPGQS